MFLLQHLFNLLNGQLLRCNERHLTVPLQVDARGLTFAPLERVAIAQEQYLQVTESDFEQAAGTLGQPSGSVDPLVDPSLGKQGPLDPSPKLKNPIKKGL